MLRRLQSVLCRSKNLGIFDTFSIPKRLRGPELIHRATIYTSTRCPCASEIVDHQQSTTTQETENEPINRMRNSILEESNVFLDDQTLDMEKRIRLSREELAKHRKFQRECLRKVMDIADGKMDFEPLELNVLFESLKLALILNRQSFLVMYYDTWWRIFEACIEKLNPQLESLSLNDESSQKILNELEEIISKLGVLNAHTNALLRSLMQTSHIRFLQILVAKVLPIASSKFINKLCGSLQNLYTLEDARCSWNFISDNLKTKLVDRLKQLQLDLCQMSDADQKLSAIDVYTCISRTAYTFLFVNCRLQSDHEQFLLENCLKITDVINEHSPDILNFNQHDLAAFAEHLCAACTGQISASHVISTWGDLDKLEREKFWQKWLTSVAFLIERAEKMPLFTPGSSAIRKSEYDRLWTIISRLLSTAIFTAIRTRNMEKFDEMRSVWLTCFERCLPSLSHSRLAFFYNETLVAEFDLLKDVSLKTMDTKLINNDIREKLLKRVLVSKEKRIAPYLRAVTANDGDQYENDERIKNRLSGRGAAVDARADTRVERGRYRTRYAVEPVSRGGDNYGEGRFERFDNRNEEDVRHFGRPRFDEGQLSYREERNSRYNAQRRESTQRFDRDNFERKPARYNRDDTEDDVVTSETKYRRLNSSQVNNFADEPIESDQDSVDFSSKPPSFRRKLQTAKQNTYNADREKSSERNQPDLMDDFEGDDDFGSLAPKNRRQRRTSSRSSSNKKFVEDDSEFL